MAKISIQINGLVSKCVIVVLLVLSSSISYLTGAEGIIGQRASCENEGEMVPMDKPNMQCFTCMCKNGFVSCVGECKSPEGCHRIEQKPKPGKCCRECKGCVYNGAEHESDTQWKDPHQPCKTFYCKAGVITITNETCYNPFCATVLPPLPGECCPSCSGCMLNGQKIPNGKEMTTAEDPCLKCVCHDQYLTCTKRACPVLQCGPDYEFTPPGECCPICRGTKSVAELSPGVCLLGMNIYSRKTSPRQLDSCTQCTCSNVTSICERRTCPVLTCPVEAQKTEPNSCCPECPRPEESRAACILRGVTYEDKETWRLDSCVSCTCVGGSPRCAREMCPKSQVCLPNQKLVQEKGECCPKCVDRDGICTVFGDPHYRTFDGKAFNYQGSCKYLLAADCVGRSFSIRVTNDARSSLTSAWTKTISVMIGNLKVNLGQKLRVKVNGKRVELPFELDRKIQVTKVDDNVMLSTSLGVNVYWNGNSFLEVTVPVIFKSRLCGLCGNYNSIPKDDLKTREGVLTNDTNKFGLSWRVGGKRSCDRDKDTYKKCIPQHKKYRKTKDYSALCRQLDESSVFAACREKVSNQFYFKACEEDMCDCPSKRCYCESFHAYVRECERVGVQINNWRKLTNCPSNWYKHRHSPDNKSYPSSERTTTINKSSRRHSWLGKHVDRPRNQERPPPPTIQ